MVYTMTVGATLGASQTGLTLEAQLVNTSGANVGSAVTTGFSEPVAGSGSYLWNYASFPDGHRGGVIFRISGGGAFKALVAINPEEAEYISTRLPTALVSGRIDASVGAMAANTLTASALATDAVTEMQTGLASQTSVDDLPTNAELATALASADDAVLAAVAALNNLSPAGVRTAIGLATANLDTQLDAVPTNAELATALGTADDAVLAAISGLNNLSAANVRTAVGLGSANLDTQLGAIAGYIDTEVSTLVTNVATILAAVDTEVAAIKAKTDALPAAPAATGDIPTAAQILTTAMTEAYSADGAAPTLAQALFLILQRLTEFSISGTTITVKKLDGSATAATLTMDDASAPTSSTRAS